MKKNLFSQIELLFWNFAIRMLSSIRMARSALASTDQLTYSSDAAFLWVLMAIAGVTGLASGYLFYFITASIR
jgi:hypothetical protein